MTRQEFNDMLCTIMNWEANAQAAGVPDSSLDISLGNNLYLTLLYEADSPLRYTIVHTHDGDYTDRSYDFNTRSDRDRHVLLHAINDALEDYEAATPDAVGYRSCIEDWTSHTDDNVDGYLDIDPDDDPDFVAEQREAVRLYNSFCI